MSIGKILKKTMEVANKFEEKSADWGEKFSQKFNEFADKAGEFAEREILKDDLQEEIDTASNELIDSLINRENPATLTNSERALITRIRQAAIQLEELLDDGEEEDECEEDCGCCCGDESTSSCICSVCGNEISEEDSFCTECGAVHLTPENCSEIIKRKFFKADGSPEARDIILYDNSIFKSRTFEALLPDGTIELKNTRGAIDSISISEIKDIQ